MASKQEDVRDEVAYDKLQHGLNPDCRRQATQQIPVSETQALQSDQEVYTPSVTPSKELIVSVTGHSLQSNRERIISSITSEKASETTDIVHVPQTSQEGSTPTLREKVSEDGYNWRKYGQKFVRGNEFIRSYYKCTRPSCQAKKQLDYTHNGHIADTVYFGEHCHPQLPNVPLAVGFAVSVVEEKPDDSSAGIAKDKSSNAHDQTPHQIEPADKPQLSVVLASDDTKSSPLQLNGTKDEIDYDDRPGLKRRKKDDNCADATLPERPTVEQRVVIQTLSEVDIVNDGYRWRKYGQKLVKGNPNPRNYYRCSGSGCPVKKHVERASHDPKLVITTYEGRHDHDMPPSRTVTHNTAGTNSNKTANNGESATKLDEGGAVCLDAAVNSSSEPQSKSSEDPNGESKTTTNVTGTTGSAMVEQSILDPESKSNEQQKCKTGTIEGSNIGHDSINVILCEKVRSTDQPHSDSETKSEQTSTACHDAVVHVATSPENNFSEQEQTPKAEAVRS